MTKKKTAKLPSLHAMLARMPGVAKKIREEYKRLDGEGQELLATIPITGDDLWPKAAVADRAKRLAAADEKADLAEVRKAAKKKAKAEKVAKAKPAAKAPKINPKTGKRFPTAQQIASLTKARRNAKKARLAAAKAKPKKKAPAKAAASKKGKK